MRISGINTPAAHVLAFLIPGIFLSSPSLLPHRYKYNLIIRQTQAENPKNRLWEFPKTVSVMKALDFLQFADQRQDFHTSTGQYRFPLFKLGLRKHRC